MIETIELCLADNHNAWDLGADGRWTRRRPPSAEATINAQEELMRLHTLRAAESGSVAER